MEFMRNTLVMRPLKLFIHGDFHEAVSKMTIIDAFLFLVKYFTLNSSFPFLDFLSFSLYISTVSFVYEQIVQTVDKLCNWHRLPVLFGMFYLGARRHLNWKYNLLNVGQSSSSSGVGFNPRNFPYRTSDGKYNDPFNEDAGSQCTFFGTLAGTCYLFYQENKVLQFSIFYCCND